MKALEFLSRLGTRVFAAGEVRGVARGAASSAEHATAASLVVGAPAEEAESAARARVAVHAAEVVLADGFRSPRAAHARRYGILSETDERVGRDVMGCRDGGRVGGGWALSVGRIEDWENGFFLGADDEDRCRGMTTRAVVCLR